MGFVNFLEAIGIKTILFVAGLGGGLANLMKESKLNFWQRFLAVLTGGFSANYLTPLVGSLMNLTDDTLYGIAFLVGFGGLKSIEILFERVVNKKDKKDE
jgi:hypothetical protein